MAVSQVLLAIGKGNPMLKLNKEYAEKFYKAYPEDLERAIEQLRGGDDRALPLLYKGLVHKDGQIVNKAAEEIAGYMAGLDDRKLIRLEENFRQCSSMEWTIRWEIVEPEILKESIRKPEDYLWVLRLGTFHPNGYFREKCVRALAEDMYSVKYVILRLNDWVKQVREAAETVCFKVTELSPEQLVECLPYLEKVKQGGRRELRSFTGLEKSIAAGISNQLQSVDLLHLNRYAPETRKILYRLLLERNVLNKEEIHQILSREKNTQCLLLIMTRFLAAYELTEEELDTFLTHKNKVIQRRALERKYSLVKDYWDGLEELLLASSIGVRGLVCYILKRHTGLGIVTYYKERLATTHKKICILGIGENGSPEDVQDLLPFLQEENGSVVKSTLHAISLLIGEEAKDIFWKYLQDERTTVICGAYKEILANGIRYGAKNVYELLTGASSDLLREKMIHLLVRERVWDRLPYLLKLYQYEDVELQEILRRGLEHRSLYERVTVEEAEEIRRILQDERYGIPEKLRKGIEFDLKFVTK